MGGVIYAAFLQGSTHLAPAFIEGARLHELCREALRYPPIRLSDPEFIRLYLVRENRQAVDAGTAPTRPALLFVNGHVPDRSDPHYDLAYWNYATYS